MGHEIDREPSAGRPLAHEKAWAVPDGTLPQRIE